MKPRALHRGSRIGVVAPSGPVLRERLEAGCDALRSEGYEVELGESVLERDRYFAGPAERRACDLNTMIRRDDIDCILTARGGYGANYLLHRIEMGVLRSRPKFFGGYSDVTPLLCTFHDRCDLPVLHAPLVAGDWSRDNGVDLDSWRAVVGGKRHAYKIPTTLREGLTEGKLYGGCLSLLAAAIGTSHEPRTEQTILFIEDVNEPAYRIDRMLRQLELAEKLQCVNGLVFGAMEKCGDNIAGDIVAMLAHLNKPIAFGLPSGHVSTAHQTLAFGLQVRLDVKPSGATLTMLESATE